MVKVLVCIFFKFILVKTFFRCRNHCLHVTSLGSIISTLQITLTLVMDITEIKDYQDDIVKEANIKILAPQKLAKD